MSSNGILDDFGLAELLSVPPTWVARHARAGDIPHMMVGRYRRYNLSSPEFQTWLDSLRSGKYDAPTEQGEPQEASMARTTDQEGHIELREKDTISRWVLRYRLLQGGRWVHKTETLKECVTEKDALKARKARMTEINALNKKGGTVALTLSQFIESDSWTGYLGQKKYKPSTTYNYESLLRLYVLPAIGSKSLTAITPDHITSLFTDLRKRDKPRKLEAKYLLNIYNLLSLIFQVAREYDFIETSPLRPRLHRPQWEGTPKPVLTPEQIRKVVEAIAPDYRTLFVTVALTGLRSGEVLALQWSEVNLKERTLIVSQSLWRKRLVTPKTRGSVRTIYLAPVLLDLLQRHQESSQFTDETNFVFCREDGSPHDPDSLRKRILYPALKQLGIERQKGTHGLHMFRHSAATILHSATRDLKVAQMLLGHSRIDTTADVYTHVDPEVTREATETLAKEVLGNRGPAVARQSPERVN